jgi:hypothetical protein
MSYRTKNRHNHLHKKQSMNLQQGLPMTHNLLLDIREDPPLLSNSTQDESAG